MYCVLISCHMYSHLFWSSGMSSEKEVNLEVRSLYSREHYKNMEKVAFMTLRL